MKIGKFEKIVCLAILFSTFNLALQTSNVWAGPGTSSGDFLKIAVGARQAAMGGAASGLADDASALYWNPAGLGLLAQQELSFLHTQWFDGITYEYLSYAHPVKSLGTFGAHLALLNYGAIESYDEGGAGLGQTSAKDWLGSFGWGSPILKDRFRVGLAIKLVQEKLASYSATGFALDLGALALAWETPEASLQLGAGLRHLGGGLTFISESHPFPRTAYFGLALKALQDSLAVALDGALARDDGFHASLGVEYWLVPLVAVRVGYRSGRTEAGTGLSSGVGFRIGRLYLDYTLSDFGRLGFAHRGQLSFKFGGLEEELYQQGKILMRKGLYAQAILEFNRVLQMNPRHRRAMLRIKECRNLLLKERKALEEL